MGSVCVKTRDVVFTLNMAAMYCTLFSAFKNLNTSEATKIDLLSWKERTKINTIIQYSCTVILRGGS